MSNTRKGGGGGGGVEAKHQEGGGGGGGGGGGTSSWPGLEQGLGRMEVKIFNTVGHWLMKLYTTP